MFWGRFDQNSGFHGNRKPPLSYNGKNDISTFSRLFLIRTFLYLQLTRTCIKSRTSSNFGQILVTSHINFQYGRRQRKQYNSFMATPTLKVKRWRSKGMQKKKKKKLLSWLFGADRKIRPSRFQAVTSDVFFFFFFSIRTSHS